MLVASTVPKPNVVTSIGEHETRCLVLIVNNPGIRTVKKTMLQDDWFESFSNGCSLALNSENSENVSILGYHSVLLNGIIVVFAIVDELELGLRMRTLGQNKQDQNYQ
jgi:hypothetical protein